MKGAVPKLRAKVIGCRDTCDESASAGVIDGIDIFFCAAADLARGVVGQKISYLLKRQCNNCKRSGNRRNRHDR